MMAKYVIDFKCCLDRLSNKILEVIFTGKSLGQSCGFCSYFHYNDTLIVEIVVGTVIVIIMTYYAGGALIK